MSTGQYDDLIVRAAAQYNITPRLLKLVMNLESGGNPTPKEAGQGAYGLFQIKPDTMEAMGYGRDPYNIEKAAFAAAKYLSQGIDQTGDALGAVGYYHSGSANRAAWGPNTNYHLQKAITQWNGAQVNNDPINPDSYRPTPAGSSASDVTASTSSVRQGGNVAKPDRRPRNSPAQIPAIHADERFPPDAGSTPPAVSDEDPDIAAGRQLHEQSSSSAPQAAAPSSNEDPDIAAGRQLHQQTIAPPIIPAVTPAPAVAVAPAITPAIPAPAPAVTPAVTPALAPAVTSAPPAPPPRGRLSAMAAALHDQANAPVSPTQAAANTVTSPGFWKGMDVPIDSSAEVLARIGDKTGLTNLLQAPSYEQLHAANNAAQAQFDKDHPGSQAQQAAGNMVATTGALLGGGAAIGALAKGVPYVAPVVRFMGGNTPGIGAIPAGVANGVVANTAGNLLNSSTSDQPLGKQAGQHFWESAGIGAGLGAASTIPALRNRVDLRNKYLSPEFREDAFMEYPTASINDPKMRGPSQPNPNVAELMAEQRAATKAGRAREEDPSTLDKVAEGLKSRYAGAVAGAVGGYVGHQMFGDVIGGGLVGTAVTDLATAGAGYGLQRLLASRKPPTFAEDYFRRKWLLDNGYGNLLTGVTSADPTRRAE